MPLPLYPREGDPVHTVEECESEDRPGRVRKISAIGFLNRPACSDSLYLLNYPGSARSIRQSRCLLLTALISKDTVTGVVTKVEIVLMVFVVTWMLHTFIVCEHFLSCSIKRMLTLRLGVVLL
jgi:hypothetical protein